jgi:hypothetical protein
MSTHLNRLTRSKVNDGVASVSRCGRPAMGLRCAKKNREIRKRFPDPPIFRREIPVTLAGVSVQVASWTDAACEIRG